MKITNIQSGINFKSALININAFSDIHGQIDKADNTYQTMNKYDLWEKDEKGKANYLIVGGDWFMSGNRKGFLSAPDKTFMDIQLEMYNKFVGTIKKSVPKLKSIFVPGNHEFDGGGHIFQKAVSKLDSTIISSNMNFNVSTILKNDIKSGHIVKSTIDFIPDDKNPNITHPVLNLGISPVNMKYYKKYITGIDFCNNIMQSQKNIKPIQYSDTTDEVCSIVDDFRKSYPNGIVILTSHTGVDLAQTVAQKRKIDLILNAHEHKEDIEYIGDTPIVNLAKDFRKLVNVKIKIDDNGQKSKVEVQSYNPQKEKFKKPSEVGKFYKKLLKQDTKPIYTIWSTDRTMTELSTNKIRSEDTHLARFITGVLLKQIKKRDALVDIFALNASAMRGGFKVDNNPKNTHLDVLNCLSGISVGESEIYVTDVTGEELAEIVLENYLFNQIDKEKNPIIHYAGINVKNDVLLRGYAEGLKAKDLCKYITMGDEEISINPSSIYRIANPVKYFDKANSESIKELKARSHSLECNLQDLFTEYFNTYRAIMYIPDAHKKINSVL